MVNGSDHRIDSLKYCDHSLGGAVKRMDILDAITDIATFTTNVDFETFRHNREKVLAVVKSIEILEEAVKKIPDDIRSRYPHIPWKAIALTLYSFPGDVMPRLVRFSSSFLMNSKSSSGRG